MKYFPLKDKKPYPNQIEIVKNIATSFADGKKFVFVEAPCGSGKSAIAMTMANMLGSAYYITVTKILQDQLEKEFGHPTLKGRNNYHCNFWETLVSEKYDTKEMKSWLNHPTVGKSAHKADILNCSEGPCKILGDSKHPMCMDVGGDLTKSKCEYFTSLGKVIKSPISVLNLKAFIHQMKIENRFGHRRLLIIDECLHPHTHVETDHGRVPIGVLVNKELPYKVLSFNKESKTFEYKEIVRYLKRSVAPTYKVLSGNKILYATEDHKIYCKNNIGEIEKFKLKDLKVGDLVLTKNISHSYYQEQLILGSLLGDANGSIIYPKTKKSNKKINKGKRARLRFQQGPKQFEYLDWKFSILKDFVKTNSKIISTPKSFAKTIKRFATDCNQYEVIKDCFIKDKKSPNLKWLNKIDDFGVAVWYMDDGSANHSGIIFHTEGYSLKENQIIKNWINFKYKIKSKVLKYFKKSNNKSYYYIRLNRKDSSKLTNIIGKYVIPSMRYKLYSYNNDISKITYEHIETEANKFSFEPIISISPYKTTMNYDLEVKDNHNYVAGSTVVSNCHTLETEFLNITSLTLNKFNTGVEMPFYETSEEYHKFFANINLLELLMQRQADAIAAGDTKKFDEYEDLLFKYKIFISSQDDIWLQDYDNDKFPQITFKPLYVKKIIKNFLLEYCDYVLLMSATILNAKVFRDSLGISKDECDFYKMESTFEVDNRLIYYQPVGKMNYKNKPETLPKIVKKIDEICDKYKGKKGIIHSHSFDISDYIKENVKNKNRILYQKDFKSKEELMDKHFNSKDSIILAPAMHEGISLNDDNGRFAIIVKVPYPSFMNNSQLKARMEIDRNHYDWLTLTKLVQSVGRCVRSHTDYADTYIIDGDFKNFYEETEKNMPKWFKESIVW